MFSGILNKSEIKCNSLPHTMNYMTATKDSSFFISGNITTPHTHTQTHTDETKLFNLKKSIYYIIDDFSLL